MSATTFPQLAAWVGLDWAERHHEVSLQAYPRFRVETVDGIYRLVVTSGYWDYTSTGPQWGEPVPLAHLTSGPFGIRTEGS